MKASKLTFEELTVKLGSPYTDSVIQIPSGKHYGWALGKIKFIPQTIQQARAQVKKLKNGGFDNLLMVGEWHGVENFLNTNGFKGEYNLTKSGTMCRLENVQDYISAVKKQFSI